MSSRTSTTKLSYLCDAYTGTAVTARTDYGALASTAGSGAAAGTEITGGSPAYARLALSGWTGTGANRAWSGTFNVASGTTVVEFDEYSASTAGTYLDAASLTSQTFNSQGTYQVNASLALT